MWTAAQQDRHCVGDRDRGNGIANPADATLTITDDDTRGVTVTGGALTMDEADNAGTEGTREDQASYTVVLDSEPTDDVRIDLTAPAMVTLSATSLTFTPSNWNVAQTVTATAVNDSIDNAGNERAGSITHAVVEGDSDYAGVAAESVAVTVNDDDGTPTLTLELDPTSIAESGDDNASTVTATLSGASSQAITLTVAATAVSPAAAGDFSLSGTTLTIATGSTTSTGTVTITAVDNTVDAPDKTVTVSATASGGGVANPDNQTLTIIDDDEADKELNITVSLGEGNTSTRVAENVQTAPTITVTASLAGEVTSSTARTVNVTVGDDDDTATEVDDYKAVDGFDITIAAEATSGTGSFTFTPVDDAIDENDETVSISGAFAGSDPVNLASITITDNDTRGISVTPVTLTLAEIDDPSTQNITEHRKTYSIELDSQPTGTVTVNLSNGDTTIATLSDNSLGIHSVRLGRADRHRDRCGGRHRQHGRCPHGGHHPHGQRHGHRLRGRDCRAGECHGHRRRRRADAQYRLTERRGGRQQHRHHDLQGHAVTGERQAGERRLRRRDHRHCDLGDGLRGDCLRHPHLRRRPDREDGGCHGQWRHG